MRLEVEEQIDQNIMNPIRGKKPVYKIVAEHHELTHNTHQSYFDFHIPIDMPPEFVTSLGMLVWLRDSLCSVSAMGTEIRVHCWNIKNRPNFTAKESLGNET